MPKFLYVSVETTTRELDAKTLLAVEAALRGYKVFLGPQDSILKFALRMQGGTLLYKDATAPVLKPFQLLKKRNVRVVAHDEEGFVLLNDTIYMDARLRSDTIRYVDTFLTWGQHQADLVRKVMGEYRANGEVVVTGHPRIDVLDKKFATRLYGEKKRDNVILINTKLAEANHRSGPNGWIELLEKDGTIKTEAERQRRYAQKSYKTELLCKYHELICSLQEKLPSHQIIIRPHPSENKEKWQNFSQKFDRVTVQWDKSVGYWINQADIIIHTGCTTAIEALLMGKRAIAYKPINAPEFEIMLPDELSDKAFSIAEVIQLIQQSREATEKPSLLSHFLRHDDKEYAYQRIIESLERSECKTSGVSRKNYISAVIAYALRSCMKRILHRKTVYGPDAKFRTSRDKIIDIANRLRPDASHLVQINTVVGDLYKIELRRRNRA